MYRGIKKIIEGVIKIKYRLNYEESKPFSHIIFKRT